MFLIYENVSEREKMREWGKERLVNMIRTTKTCETLKLKH